MNKRVTSVMAQLSMLSAMCGNPSLPCNHSHDHEYRDKVKTHYKGMSAEEMGTSHKKIKKAEKKIRSKKEYDKRRKKLYRLPTFWNVLVEKA